MDIFNTTGMRGSDSHSAFLNTIKLSKLKYYNALTLYTLISLYTFSILFSIDFLSFWKGEFM